LPSTEVLVPVAIEFVPIATLPFPDAVAAVPAGSLMAIDVLPVAMPFPSERPAACSGAMDSVGASATVAAPRSQCLRRFAPGEVDPTFPDMNLIPASHPWWSRPRCFDRDNGLLPPKIFLTE
jgi:hypothetical protein